MKKNIFFILTIVLFLETFSFFLLSQEFPNRTLIWIAPGENFTEFKEVEKIFENSLKISFSSTKFFEITENKNSAEIILKPEILNIKILKNQSFIDVNTKFINSENLELICELKISGTSGEKLGQITDAKILLSEAINNVTNKIVKEIQKILNTAGKVEFVKDKNNITINISSSNGIVKGTKISIFRDSRKIAEGIVKDVGILSSEVKIINYREEPKVGDIVKIISMSLIEEKKEKKYSKKFWNKSLIALGGIGFLALIANQGEEKKQTQTPSEIPSSNAKDIDLVANTTSIPADGVTKITLTALVKDSNNVAVADGTPVTFNTNRGIIIIAGGSSYATTVEGKATAYLLSTEIGTATVSAKSGSAISNNLTITFTPPPSLAASIDLTPDDNPIYIDSTTGQATTKITATVRQTDSSFVPDGTKVYFSTDKGSITGSATTTSGVATVNFSSSVTGKATITATSGNVVSNLTLNINPGPPHNMFVEVSPNTIEANGQSSSTISVTVKDISGNLVMDGTRVDFLHPDTLTAGQVKVITQTGTTGLATITPVSYTTGGVAKAILVGRDPETNKPSISGTATILIRIPKSQPPGVSSPSSDILNSETRVSLVSKQAAYIDVGAEPLNIRGLDIINVNSTITALVYDAYHNPVADGTAVYFTTDHGMIKGDGETVNRVATSVTKSGIATATISSSGSVTEGIPGNPVTMAPGTWSWDGKVHVTVTSGSVTYNPPPYTFTTLIFSGPANLYNSSVTSPRDTNLDGDLNDGDEQLDGTKRDSAVIIVQAIDINGHPVVDGTEVSFSTSKGKISPSLTTTKGGVAEATLITKENDTDEPIPPGPGYVTVKIDTKLYQSLVFTFPFTVK